MNSHFSSNQLCRIAYLPLTLPLSASFVHAKESSLSFLSRISISNSSKNHHQNTVEFHKTRCQIVIKINGASSIKFHRRCLIICILIEMGIYRIKLLAALTTSFSNEYGTNLRSTNKNEIRKTLG